MNTIYIIAICDNGLFKPTRAYSQYSDALLELSKLIAKAPDTVTHWDELGGAQFLIGEQYIRFCQMDDEKLTEGSKAYIYADAEDDKYEQIGHIAISDSKEEIDGYFADWFKRNKDTLQIPDGRELLNDYAISTDEGKCGFAEFSVTRQEIIIQ